MMHREQLTKKPKMLFVLGTVVVLAVVIVFNGPLSFLLHGPLNNQNKVLINRVTVNPFQIVTLDGHKFYDNNNFVYYKWLQIKGPILGLVGSNTAIATFTAPHPNADTVLTFKLIAKKKDGSSINDIENILVKRYNTPPIANAGSNQVVNGDGFTRVFLNGLNSHDPDGGDVASYAWSQTKYPGQIGENIKVMLHGVNTATPFFIAPKVALDTLLTFRLVVIDDDGGAYSLPAFTNVLIKHIKA
jgi:hypothetical protein